MLMPSPDRERHDGYLRNYRETGVRKIIGVGRVTPADSATETHSQWNCPSAKPGSRANGFSRVSSTTSRSASKRRSGFHELQSELAHVGRLSEMGTLASSLAHELNQPLTAIASYSEGMADLLAGEFDCRQGCTRP